MRIVNFSYSYVSSYSDPEAWLSRISFFTVILEQLTHYVNVHSIYHINFEGNCVKNNVTYYFQHLSYWQKLFPFRLHSFVKNLNPDAVIVHGLIFPWQIILLRFRLGSRVRIILQHHAERPYKDVRVWLQRWADNYVHAYLFPSIRLSEAWSTAGILKLAKVKEVFGSTSIFHPIDRQVARAKTGITSPVTFLWVGRLDDNKDPLCVVRSFIRATEGQSQFKLYLIYQTQELLPQIQALIAEHRMSEAIVLVGAVEHNELLYWYNSVDFIVSGSHYEGSGIAVCEALSCGCFPILTDIPSFRMITADGAIGMLYPAGDEQALVDCLRKSFSLSVEKERPKILARYQAEFSAEANARKIFDAIR